jgi:EAL domain-containing protein (putative c-di-GMP-specific phosphodiesterase class I)
VRTLKIDRSFVSALAGSAQSSSIVTSIIAMGRSLSLTVVAEGVETSQQLDFLRAQECDQIQGFLLGRPVPADEMLALLDEA